MTNLANLNISFGIDDHYEDSVVPIDRPSDNWSQANELFSALQELNFARPLQKTFIQLTAPDAIDSRLSVCDILLAVKPEQSLNTYVIFNHASKNVRLDISIKEEGKIVPIRS